MARIVIVDTSGATCSVAWCEDGKVVELRSDNKGGAMATASSEHSTLLAPFIDETIQKFGPPDAVAVCSGPGSYTGLRIGIATAKGLCYGSNTPLILIDSLRGIVEEVVERFGSVDMPNSVLAAMVDARRMEVYYAKYNLDGSQLTDIEAISIDKGTILTSEKLYIAGNGAKKCYDTLRLNHNDVEYIEVEPNAGSYARYAQQCYDLGKFSELAYSEPLYVKEWQPYTKSV